MLIGDWNAHKVARLVPSLLINRRVEALVKVRVVDVAWFSSLRNVSRNTCTHGHVDLPRLTALNWDSCVELPPYMVYNKDRATVTL